MKELTDKVTHGKASTYRHYGCRCIECTVAASKATSNWIDKNREKHNKKRRDKTFANKITKPDHGVYAYSQLKCRCDICKNAWSLQHKIWREKNPDKVLAINERAKMRTKEKRDWLNQLKLSLGCIDCGWNMNASGLHFDHLRDKKYDISYAATGLSFEKLFEEILKCEIVCANCHSIRTDNRRVEKQNG